MVFSNATMLVAALAAPVQGAQAAQPAPPSSAAASAVALRAVEPPAIDGRAGDAVWRSAQRYDGFRQFEPRLDADPSFRTEFQVAHDDRNLYVYVRAWDPRPDSVGRALTRRDVRGPSDQIGIYIDSWHDGRTGYSFYVNPDGVRRDFAIYNDNEQDASWNGVWDAATAVDSLGWSAEFRIPLSQLRYADAPSHSFGFGVWREIERYRERLSWPLYAPTRTGLISQLGRLDGLAGIRSPARLELTPYVLTRNVGRPAGAGLFDRVQEVAVGADLKYGLTPNVTLDATVNPDFGQVEADPAVLNLTAFETFLSERRPFFVEGTGFYRFALNCYIVVDCNTNEGLFYSRRIGRSPALRDDYGDASSPTATPIALAAKLTGRTRHGLSFGLLDAVTPRVEGVADRTIEPGANFAVLRAQQDLRGGDAGVSVIATAVNRTLDSWTSPTLHAAAYTAGASFRNRLFGGQYEVAGSFTASRVSGSRAAMLRTQRGAVHYYQQPGDDLEVDSTRTSLSGHGLHLKFGKYGGGITRFETSLLRQSAGFEVNDLGFLRRADVLDWSTWAALNFRDARGIYRWMQLNANHWQTWNTSGLRLESAVNVNGHLGLRNNWDVHAGATLGRLGESFCDRCTRGGPALRRSPAVFPWFGVNGDSRRRIVPSMWVNLTFADEGRTHSVSLNPSIVFRLSTRLQGQLAAGISTTEDDAQWYENFADSLTGATHYTFARLDQRTVSMSLRVNYTATPDLTFEFYGAPFVSKGTWSDFREVSATPAAKRYAARFQPFVPPAGSDVAFDVQQLRTNAVLRWEYRPASTLFLVWAHGREARTDRESQQPWHADYRELFDLHPDNTFLIKIAYWLNR